MDFIKGNEQVKIDPDGIDISGTSNIVVKSEGKVGIGTNNPQYPLQVNGSPAIFSNNPELLLFKQEGPGRLGPTLNWGTENFTDWKIKAEDSGLKFMRGINGKTYEKLSLLNNGTIDISGDVSLNGDLSLNGDISMNGTIDISGDITINGDTSFNKNVTISGGDLNIYDENGNSMLKTDRNFPMFLIDARASSSYNATYTIDKVYDDDNTTFWSCGSNETYSQLAVDRAGLRDGNFYASSNGEAWGSSYSAYTYFFTENNQTEYNASVNYRYGEWIQFEYVNPGIFQGFEITTGGNGGDAKNITILGSNIGFGYTADIPPAWYRIFEFDDIPNSSGTTYTYGVDSPTGIKTDLTNQPFRYFRIIIRKNHGYGYVRLYNFKLNFKASSTSNVVDIPLLYSKDIQSSRVLVTSDSRIKNDITLVDDTKAIDMVNTLESKEYGYIDPYNKKTQKTIGFIAQEVKDVLPNAVTIENGFIPDEIREILNPVWNTNSDGSWTLTIVDIVFQANHTGKCRFYFGETKKDIQVETDRVSFKFNRKWDNVYLWGKEINDFHMIDKNQIFALHHSAIQELSRRNDEKSSKILVLEESNEEKDQKLLALEERIGAIEKLLQETTTLQNNTQETQNTESTSLFQKV